MAAAPSDARRRRTTGMGGLVALAMVAFATLVVAGNPSLLTRSTIHLALVEYAAALWLMLEATPEDWRAATPRGQRMRWLWTWACLTFLMHVASAFHFTHHWSHAHAFEQTRLESGVGEGLYVNDLFMAVWAADVFWWWIAPAAYAIRSSAIDRVLHSFMLFIAFNATVVFETGLVRYVGAAGFLMLAMRSLQRRRSVDSDDSATHR